MVRLRCPPLPLRLGFDFLLLGIHLSDNPKHFFFFFVVIVVVVVGVVVLLLFLLHRLIGDSPLRWHAIFHRLGFFFSRFLLHRLCPPPIVKELDIQHFRGESLSYPSTWHRFPVVFFLEGGESVRRFDSFGVSSWCGAGGRPRRRCPPRRNVLLCGPSFGFFGFFLFWVAIEEKKREKPSTVVAARPCKRGPPPPKGLPRGILRDTSFLHHSLVVLLLCRRRILSHGFSISLKVFYRREDPGCVERFRHDRHRLRFLLHL